MSVILLLRFFAVTLHPLYSFFFIREITKCTRHDLSWVERCSSVAGAVDGNATAWVISVSRRRRSTSYSRRPCGRTSIEHVQHLHNIGAHKRRQTPAGRPVQRSRYIIRSTGAVRPSVSYMGKKSYGDRVGDCLTIRTPPAASGMLRRVLYYSRCWSAGGLTQAVMDSS